MLGLKYLYKKYTTKSLAIQRSCDRGQELVKKLEKTLALRILLSKGYIHTQSKGSATLRDGQSQPRTQACSRYPSDQRRLGTERDRRIFPTNLIGDVTSEIAEDDWERGWDSLVPSCPDRSATTRFQFYTGGTTRYTLDTFFQKAHSFSLNFTTTLQRFEKQIELLL